MKKYYAQLQNYNRLGLDVTGAWTLHDEVEMACVGVKVVVTVAAGVDAWYELVIRRKQRVAVCHREVFVHGWDVAAISVQVQPLLLWEPHLHSHRSSWVFNVAVVQHVELEVLGRDARHHHLIFLSCGDHGEEGGQPFCASVS